MARLTTIRRNALPQSSFALPGGRYPIEDRSHAANALSRVSQNGTPAEKAVVRAKVNARYGMGRTLMGACTGAAGMPMAARAPMRVGAAPCTVCGMKHAGGQHVGAYTGGGVMKGAKT